MAHLVKDRRGYPVPAMVMRDGSGRPHFQINDELSRQQIIAEDLCAICARKLLRGRWFVGGPMCAFSERGLYVDPPLHQECAEYALRVCPYLAAPSYAKRIDGATLKGTDRQHAVLVDPTMIPDRPPVFVAVMAVGQDYFFARGEHAVFGLGPEHVRYTRHHVGSARRVEVWRHGERVTYPAELRGYFEAVRAELRHDYGERGRPDMWRLVGLPAKEELAA